MEHTININIKVSLDKLESLGNIAQSIFNNALQKKEEKKEKKID